MIYVWRMVTEKLRLAEDFEMLRLAPNFETLCLTTCDFITLRLTSARRQPDTKFRNQKIASGGTYWKVAPDTWFWNVASDDMWFQNIASDARLPDASLAQPDVTFLNQSSDIIFCDHASDVQYESGYV